MIIKMVCISNHLLALNFKLNINNSILIQDFHLHSQFPNIPTTLCFGGSAPMSPFDNIYGGSSQMLPQDQIYDDNSQQQKKNHHVDQGRTILIGHPKKTRHCAPLGYRSLKIAPLVLINREAHYGSASKRNLLPL